MNKTPARCPDDQKVIDDLSRKIEEQEKIHEGLKKDLDKLKKEFNEYKIRHPENVGIKNGKPCVPRNQNIQQVKVLCSNCVYDCKLESRTVEQFAVLKLTDKSPERGECSCRLQQKRNQESVVTIRTLRQGVKGGQSPYGLGECRNEMMIQHEYPEGEHIRRDRQPIADALFFRKQIISPPRRLRCCMHERILWVTWEIHPHPERVTIPISKTKWNGMCEWKSDQGIVAVKSWKHEGAKDLKFGLFLFQGRGHNSEEVLYAEY